MMEEGQFVEIVNFFGNWYGNSFESIFKVALEGKICVMDLELEVIAVVVANGYRAFWRSSAATSIPDTST